MPSSDKQPVQTEITEISDADRPPKACPSCGCTDYRRKTYHFRDLYALGDVRTKRIVRYEAITWECKECNTTFHMDYPEIPSNSPYLPSVKEYALYRIKKKGDSGRRVAEDLTVLHQVEVTSATVNSWVHDEKGKQKEEVPTKFDSDDTVKDFSKVLAIDGTFKAIKPKKNDQAKKLKGPSCLHLTRLKDGRLAAYWHEGKPKKKSKDFSEK